MLETVGPVLEQAETLRGPGDPPPYEVLNAEGGARVLIICDHASRALPAACDGLGLDELELRRHIAWDIGAADVTRRLAAALDAPAVLCGYSRLLIDCNRALDDPTSIVVISDGSVIPRNRKVDQAEAARRAATVYHPYHDAIRQLLRCFDEQGVVPVVISVHSYTPIMNGVERPWHVGVLWDRDPRIARPLMEILGAEPSVEVGDNQPYSARSHYGYSIDEHAANAGRAHVLIELRQDLIDTHHGAEAWAERLARVLEPILGDQDLYRVAHY